MTIIEARQIADDLIGGPKGINSHSAAVADQAAAKIKEVRDYWAAKGQPVHRDSERLRDLAELATFR